MPIKVIITSDFLCPWCYLGEARLQKAVQSLGLEKKVELKWQPCELNPDMTAGGMDRKAYRSRKFGWGRSLQMDAQLAALGREEGLNFNFPTITRAANTRLAHRLTLFAERYGRASD
ncbi:DsbA family protein [Modicisalibacter luteus]|uniref:DsbA family protein n=1 Tax=Modicisalibacter luteus TaxID=453962 RepID=A0ABV7LWX4_9GAMM|nr:DsbA family protein [Halomonas lutea]